MSGRARLVAMPASFNAIKPRLRAQAPCQRLLPNASHTPASINSTSSQPPVTLDPTTPLMIASKFLVGPKRGPVATRFGR